LEDQIRHMKHISDSQVPTMPTQAIMPDGDGRFVPCPELLTEDELILFLRIPAITSADNYHNVIEHLKRARNLPRIYICNKTLYPLRAILEWIDREKVTGK
jgi:hypothetical protein